MIQTRGDKRMGARQSNHFLPPYLLLFAPLFMRIIKTASANCQQQQQRYCARPLASGAMGETLILSGANHSSHFSFSLTSRGPPSLVFRQKHIAQISVIYVRSSWLLVCQLIADQLAMRSVLRKKSFYFAAPYEVSLSQSLSIGRHYCAIPRLAMPNERNYIGGGPQWARVGGALIATKRWLLEGKLTPASEKKLQTGQPVVVVVLQDAPGPLHYA